MQRYFRRMRVSIACGDYFCARTLLTFCVTYLPSNAVGAAPINQVVPYLCVAFHQKNVIRTVKSVDSICVNW